MTRPIWVTILLCLSAATVAAGQVYRWVDDKGVATTPTNRRRPRRAR
jgi:hypothetical protein